MALTWHPPLLHPPNPSSRPLSVHRPPTTRPPPIFTVTMRDRAKNRKPLQRGRYLSVEAIQAIQALKLAIHVPSTVDRIIQSKVRRLLKFDMLAVLAELQAQRFPLLALQVFGEIRNEHWYAPRFSVYAAMVRALARDGLVEEVEVVLKCLVEERGFGTDGFDELLEALLEFGRVGAAVDCLFMMERWGVRPEESTFGIVVRGLEARGEFGASAVVRREAFRWFGRELELEDTEDTQEMFSLPRQAHDGDIRPGSETVFS